MKAHRSSASDAMRKVPSIRRFASDEWRMYRDLRLRSLADSPDAFGTTVAQAQERPKAEWSTQVVTGAISRSDLPLLAELDGRPAGLAWVKIDASEREKAHLYQMWVAPECRHFGAGRMLLEAGIAWARSEGVHFLVLGVTCGDTPAKRLYSRAGFQPGGAPEPLRWGSTVLVQPMHLDLRPPAG
jgi:ribosomal protein S18 acetylase RimI-like enzyme